MADPIDHLATVRAALDLAGKATPGEWWQGAVERHHVFAERGNPSLIAPEAGRVLLRMSEHFPAYAHDAAAIVALRNAAPAIAALADECERLRKELDVAADCGIMRGRSWETTEWEAATGFRSKLEARRALAAFRIACAEATRDADIADAARRLLGEE